MIKETMKWVQLGLLAALIGGTLGSPTKAFADPTIGRPAIYQKLPACECNASSGCFCN